MTTQRPVFIEIAINEAVTRAQHRFVPVTPEECAADAIASVQAGASYAHWHASSLDAYAAGWRGMREADVIAYPSYPNEPPDDVDTRLGHCFTLVERDGLEMAPLDLGTAHTIMWDGEELGGGGTLANPLSFLTRAAARYRAYGAIANLASFDLGHTRPAVRLARAGILEPPLLLKIYLSDTWIAGPSPSREALDLHLAELPADLEVHWLVVPFLLHARDLRDALSPRPRARRRIPRRDRRQSEPVFRHAQPRAGRAGPAVDRSERPSRRDDARRARAAAIPRELTREPGAPSNGHRAQGNTPASTWIRWPVVEDGKNKRPSPHRRYLALRRMARPGAGRGSRFENREFLGDGSAGSCRPARDAYRLRPYSDPGRQ